MPAPVGNATVASGGLLVFRAPSLLVLSVVLAVLTPKTHAQCVRQQVARLQGIGTVGGSDFGISVCLDGAGNTALVGADSDNGGRGAVFVFVRSGATWTQQGNRLVPSTAVPVTGFGSSVALSADGNTAIIGAIGNNQDDFGAAYVYVRSGSNWSQQGPKLVPTDGTINGRFGYSASISADGNTAVIGAHGSIFNPNGAAFVFVRSGATWSQQGPKLAPIGGVGASGLGSSVSVSADGNTVIMGAPFDDGFLGAAFVFSRSGTAWSQQGPKLTASAPASAGRFGSSVSLSADGGIAVVGAPADTGYIGAAFIFVRSTGGWVQQGPKLVASGSPGAVWFGTSVSLNGAGNMAIVGASRFGSVQGAAYLFVRSGNAWAQQGTRLDPVGGCCGFFGASVALSRDGNWAMGGAYGQESAYVYRVCPPAGCAADFNGVAGVTVADVFAFLTAWFANNLAADFDHNGLIQVQDIFAFLRAWFAGCP